jgi:DNA modification methylase
MRLLTNPFFGAGKLVDNLLKNSSNAVVLRIGTNQVLRHTQVENIAFKYNNKLHFNRIVVFNKEDDLLPKIPPLYYSFDNYSKVVIPNYVLQSKLDKEIEFRSLFAGRITYYKILEKNTNKGNKEKSIDFLKTIDLPNIDDLPLYVSTEGTGINDSFYTPINLAEKMARYLKGSGPVIDPFCGNGNLLFAAIKTGVCTENEVVGYDIDEEAIEVARKRMPKGKFEILDTVKNRPQELC